MAVTQTSLSPTPMVFPFLGLGQLGLDRSNVPRSEIVYSGEAVVVTAGMVGEEQRLDITCELPQNFSYALAEFHCDIATAGGTTNSWDADAIAFMVDAVGTDRTINVSMPITAEGIVDDVVLPRRVYNLQNPMRAVLVPPPNTIGAKLGATFNNDVQAAVQAAVTFYIRFYQFDIEQAHHYSVNTPTLIR